MVQCLEVSNYNELTLRETPKSFWTGFPETVKGASIFLKPNLVNPNTNWDRCSTTRWEVVDLVIQKLIQEGAGRIVIGECGFKDQWDNTITSTRYSRLLRRYPGLELIPLQDGPNFHKFTLKRIPEGKYRSLFGAKFSDYMLACDMVINLPKMKVHQMAGVTGAIKNMMGTMTQKGSMHPKCNVDILHKRLADLFILTAPMVQFIVMDGIIGAEYSEQCGRPVKSNVILSGADQWEVDVAGAKLMGYNPREIPYLRYIRTDFDSVVVPEHLIQSYERPLRWRKK